MPVTSTIDANENNFYTLTYIAWSECAIGGTLNDIAIRNDSTEMLIVDQLSLKMLRNGIDITAKDAPRIYNDHVISSSARRVYKWQIEPGERLHFGFPVSNCGALAGTDELHYEFRASFRAGDKRYESDATFKKTITSSPGDWP